MEEQRGKKRSGGMKKWPQFGPAPSGVVGTAGEDGDEVVAVEEMKPREKRRLPRRSRRNPRPVATPPPEESVVANQETPGSRPATPMKEFKDGQRQQEEVDGIFEDPRIIQMKEDLVAGNNEVRKANAVLSNNLEARDQEIKELNEKLRKQGTGLLQQNNYLSEMEIHLEKCDRANKDTNAESQAQKQRVQISQGVIDQLKREVASLTSDLADTTHAKHELEAEKDEAEVIIKGLHERVDTLENEAASHQTIAAENTSLQEQIAEVHASLEDAFSNMAKGLTIDEKFAYVREHQTAAPTGRPRMVSSASITEELDHHSEAEPEHAVVAPKQNLTFADITSVETAPVAAPAAVITKQNLTLTGITSVETAPVAAPAAPKENLTLTGITSVETAPVAAPTAAAIESTAPFTFKGISTIETAPFHAVPAPQPAYFASKPTPAASKVKYQNRRIYIHEPVDRPFVPWWMWLLLLIAILTCAGGFVGLLREKQIWLDANDLAYQRLVGGEQETWVEWAGLGARDLFPGLGPHIGGLSLFG